MTNFWKVFRFGVVGVATALLYYALLYVAVESLGMSPPVGSSLVYAIVIGFNYLMHYSWTFAEPAPHTKTLSRYLVMIFCGFLINGSIMYIGVSHFGINYLLIQAVAFVMVILWNFSVALLWVFRS